MSVPIESIAEKRPKLNDIVILRGIACIFVMLVHITSDAAINLRVGSISSIIFSFINTSSTYVVPTFIFLSGYTLYYRYKDCELNIADFYYKRFKSTLTPYIAWVIIYYVVFIKFFGYPISITFFIKNLVLGTMVYHLYFIAIISQFYLVFPIILYLYKRFNALFITFIMLLLNAISHKFFISQYSARFFLNYIFFFGLGCIFATYRNKTNEFIKNHNIFIILLNTIATVFYVIEIYLGRNYGININPIGYTWHIFCVTSILFYYYCSIIIEERCIRAVKLLKSMSINSYTIYLAHPIVIMALDYLYKGQSSIVLKTVFKGTVVLMVFSLYSLYKDNLYEKFKNKTHKA